MVDNLIIIVGLLLAFVTGFILCLKSVHIGLKWKVQIENNEIPKINNPITEIKKAKEENKLQQYSKDQINEWLNGGD